MRMEELKKMQSSVHEAVQSVEDSVQQGVDQLRTTLTDAQTEENPPTGLSASRPHAESESQQPAPTINESSHRTPDKEGK